MVEHLQATREPRTSNQSSRRGSRGLIFFIPCSPPFVVHRSFPSHTSPQINRVSKKEELHIARDHRINSLVINRLYAFLLNHTTMPTIFQPITQVKLTNVAVVRYNSHGKRFEIACYRNKIMDYRSGLEKDLGEVLQTDRIFTNVSKGEFSNTKDLEAAFGTRNEEDIAKIILEKGTMQVSDREREQQLENTLSQVATWVASNCVHPESNRPYTATQIKHALERNYNIQPHKAMKKQYLDAVKYLKTIIPIERAKMELSLQFPNENDSIVDDVLNRMEHKLVSEQKTKDTTTLLLQVDPSLYRELEELAKSAAGRLEISQHVVAQQGDIDLDKEVERKQLQIHEDTALSMVETKVITELDPEADAITQKLQKMRTEHDSSDEEARPMSRKEQKKIQKKSKKDKRREKEQELERLRKEDEEKERAEGRNEKASSSEAAIRNAEAQLLQDSKSCNTCGGSFESAATYRAHFRSDWHRFNQKLKLKGVSPVSEEEFKLCDEETFFGG